MVSDRITLDYANPLIRLVISSFVIIHLKPHLKPSIRHPHSNAHGQFRCRFNPWPTPTRRTLRAAHFTPHPPRLNHWRKHHPTIKRPFISDRPLRCLSGPYTVNRHFTSLCDD